MEYLVRYEAVINGATKDDFFKGTRANFVSCDIPAGNPDYVSESGSVYFYSDEGVVRVSNHWTGAASCRWTLDNEDEYNGFLAVNKKEIAVAGFCKWGDFSKIGFIEEIKEMPSGTRKNSWKVVGGIGYKVLEKAV